MRNSVKNKKKGTGFLKQKTKKPVKINKSERKETSFSLKEVVLVVVVALSILLFLSNFGLCGLIGIAAKNALYSIFGQMGTIIIELALIIICFVIITGKPLFSGFTKKSIETTDKIGKEAFTMAKGASEAFTKKIEEAKMERRLDSLNIKDRDNVVDTFYSNLKAEEDAKKAQSILGEKIEETKQELEANENKNASFQDKEIAGNNIPFNLFRSDKKSVSQVESNNLTNVNFNRDVDPMLKQVIATEKNIDLKNKQEQNKYMSSSIFDLHSEHISSSKNTDSKEDILIRINEANNNTENDYSNVNENLSTENNTEYSYNNEVKNQLNIETNELNNTSEKEDVLHSREDISYESKIRTEKSKNIDDAISANNKHLEEQAYKEMQKPKKTHKAYHFPPMNYLNKSNAQGKVDKEYLQNQADILQQTLQQFGVGAHVTNVSIGPAVTRFELQPEVGVRVNKITSLEDDLKLALAAKEIRIEAPIPGKQAIGIEVPNAENSMVCLGDIITSREFRDAKSKLTIALGKDVAGKMVVSDIAKMPHVLIAGATGSGKSICINSIIMSLIYKATPEEVQLMMIDPKVVELQGYNGIPHLHTKVITDPMKAKAALNWAVAEMTRRYQAFADYGVKDLEGYNRVAEEKMPQFVIIIDELADLMMAASKEVENSIVRIAQLARACGMHLVIATQRPMASVVTGLIKANVPSRIAFAVSSGLDSRIILDSQGAEKLLGKGDMLFLPIGSNQATRIQGCYVSEEEIEKVIDYIRVEEDEEEENNRQNEINNFTISNGDSGSDVDDLFIECGKLCIQVGSASAGNLQRKFKIGFNRAARIIDQLEEKCVVGAQEGKKPRDILMTMEEFDAKFH